MIKIHKLVVKAINGDKEAFDELALMHKKYLYSIASKKLYNEQDIEDLVQTTLYKAYKEIHTLSSPYKFKSWITTILYREYFDICRNDIKQKKIIQKMCKYAKVADTDFDIDEFDNLIKSLDDKEKRILELLYKQDLSYKKTAQELNMNETTVKYYAYTRLKLLKKILTKKFILIFVLCFLIAGVVSAVTLISYLKKSFSTKDVGVNNDGILMAVENLDWYQQVDMDYQDVGDGYKIKLDYLLMDEMCLYMIFDLESEKDLSKYTDVSLPYLKIVDESGNVICDKYDVKTVQYAQVFGSKLIENNNHHMKFLVYMYAESFPNSKTLSINFSNITLYRKNIMNTSIDSLSCSLNSSVDLLEKFTNREYTNYTSNNNIIKTAIVSDTGFYAIIEPQTYYNDLVFLVDEYGTYYDCYIYAFTNSNTLRYIIISKFNNTTLDKLNLILSNQSLELINSK